MSNTHKELYEFGSFSLDISERLLRRDGTRISLTDKAFDTLCILVRRGGELVSKDELMNEVWADSIVEENNLDQKISKLRQALGERKGKAKFIETVRGHGYRFLPAVRRIGTEQSKIDQAVKFETQSSPISDAALSAGTIETQGNVGDLGNAKSSNEPDTSEVAERRLKKDIEPRIGPRVIDSIRHRWQLTLIISAVLTVAAVATFMAFRLSDRRFQPDNSPIESIAVLPFENAAQEVEAEYLSDGISESLINYLSQISNLKVKSSGSVFRYKGANRDVQEIGNELNVRAILTGSVKQIGDQIVINVSLDDVADGHRIWGEQYVRKFADVLAVQKEIVQEVSSNLRVKLTDADERRLAKRYTDNVEAYQLYLKGMYEWNKHTKQDLQKSIEYFDQALEQDPNYALAYYGLSGTYGVLGSSYLPPHEAYPKAKEYAVKALELDEELADAHTAMGAVRLFYDWDFAEAEKEIKRSLTLDPNNAGAHHIYGDCLEVRGRFEEAKAERKRTLDLDPLSPLRNMVAGATFYFARQDDEAITQFEKTIKLEPRFYPSYFWLGQAYEQKQMLTQAIETYQKGMAQSERHPSLIAAIGHAYALEGQHDKAQRSITELGNLSNGGYIDPYFFAMVYAGLGDRDRTLAWLEKAFQARSSYLIWLGVEPLFDPMRGDPHFQDLLRRIGLDPE